MLFKKSQHGWRLLRQSLAYFQRHKKLLILPLIGRGFFFMVFGGMGLVFWAMRSKKIDYYHWSGKEILLFYAAILLAALLANMVSSYFSGTLIVCMRQNENGAKTDLSASLRAAKQRLGVIFYAILANFTLNIIAMIFRGKFKESDRLGQLLSGLNWAWAYFLVFPLIMNETAGFLPSLQRSSQLMRHFAGKNPQIHYTFAWLSLALRLLCSIPMIAGFLTGQTVWSMVGSVITVLLYLGIAVILNGTSVIISQAFYQYIAHGKTITNFQTTDLATAISPSFFIS